MFCGLRRGSSCGNGVSCKEGPEGRAGRSPGTPRARERCRAMSSQCVAWCGAGAIPVPCGSGMWGKDGRSLGMSWEEQ